MRALATNLDFRRGLRASLPICLGYLPVAVTFGVLARQTGLGLNEAGGISAFVYAGASQFIALNLVRLGTSWPVIIVTVFLVNIRHMLMSAFLAAHLKIRTHLPLLSFGVTDESFAVASSHKHTLTPHFLLGLELPPYLSWVSGTVLGFIVGDFLPPTLTAGLGIALYAMFIGLLIPAAVNSLPVTVVALVAGLTHWALTRLNIGELGMRMVAAMLIGALCGTLIWGDEKENGS